MLKRIVFGGLLIVAAAGCGDSKDVDKNDGDGGSKPANGGSGGSSSSASGGSSGSSSSSSGSEDGGPGSGPSTGGSSSASGGSGGSSSNPGSTPADGSQLARCENNDDCGDGLNCYAFGRYCSAECATDDDCASLGAGYTCNARMGGMGGIPGGGGPRGGADAAAPEPTGTCRLGCSGESDTSCPSGMSCVSAGGLTGGMRGPGGGGDGGTMSMGTFRCQYPAEEPAPRDGGMTMGDNGGDTPAFEQCGGDRDCADGLGCSRSTGFCTQDCEQTEDCTMMPGSGSATLSCSNGRCRLSCSMETTCPDGMTCIPSGGGMMGGGGNGFCGFAAMGGIPGGGGMMPGGGFPGGGG